VLHVIVIRLGQLLLVLLGISLLCFLAFEFGPGDPAYVAMRALLNVDNPPPGAVARLREEMGLGSPLPVRYLRWLGRAVTGDLGYSFQTRRPVLREVAIVLPALTIAVGFAAITVRILRNSLLAALRQEYIRVARARGLPEPTVLGKHALRNSLIPVVTYLGSQFAYLFGGTMVVETLFRWPGLGRLMVESVLARDSTVVHECVLVNLVVDLTYALIDPRIRPIATNSTAGSRGRARTSSWGRTCTVAAC